MIIKDKKLLKVDNMDISNGILAIPFDVTEIDKNAFLEIKNISKIILPNITEIPDNLFNDLKTLKSVILPSSIKRIGNASFKNCVRLEIIIIPSNTTEIGYEAFSGCESLKMVVFPKNITAIKGKTFFNCTNLRKIIIPKKVTKIEKEAFFNCNSLSNIILPNALEQIGENAFSECSYLKSINLPKFLKTIEKGAFSKSGIENIEIPNTINQISPEMFYQCINLKNITFPSSITSIQQSAFSGCINLKQISLPSSLQHIGQNSFYSCENLTKINIPPLVKTIGDSAFKNCSNLTNINIPNLNEIKFSTFFNCTSLEQLFLPETITKIEESSFENCKSLKSINIPNNIEIIENNAFKNCLSLKKIKIKNTIKKIGQMGANSLSFFEPIDENYFYLSTIKQENSIPLSKFQINPAFISRHLDYKSILLREQQNELVSDFYNTFVSNFSWDMADNFLEFHNFTYFKQLEKYKNLIFSNLGFYKLLFNLGGFLPPVDDDGNESNYAQKVIEFFIKQIDNKKFNISKLPNLDLMNINGFKKDFTDFFLLYFNEIMESQKTIPNFISNCYNEFEIIKSKLVSGNNQNISNLTIKNIIEFLKHNQINSAISVYTNENTINEEHLNNSIILNENIKNLQLSVINSFVKIAINEFSLVWIELNDPQNLILGKLCLCSAHVEELGFGVKKTFIDNQNIKTLVIRDKHSKIIAKSTIFVNSKQGYGVFNNIEISSSIPLSSHKNIFNKFVYGIKIFAEEFNQIHPFSPLRQINIGMEVEDKKLIYNHKNSKYEFVTFNFHNFKNLNYESKDDSFEKYIIWNSKN